MKINILNTWTSDNTKVNYFEETNPIYTKGNYRIFKQTNKCYLHTFKNVAISQLGAANKEHINNLLEDTRPTDKGKFTAKTLVFDSAKKALKKGLLILQAHNLKAKY